jgi:8-hydroxy-5-deazaflavin:NADPH oxidoreductase
MKVTIIGLGNMGAGLAKRLAGRTDLTLAGRDDTASASLATTVGAKSASIDEAIRGADIVILATHYGAALELARRPDLRGKIVVDISNPVKPDFSGLLLGHDTSAGETIQAAAAGARVVKAFNTIFAGLFVGANTAAVPVFLAGNDEVAVDAVAALVKTAGFSVEKTGGLEAARLLEPLGMLNIRLGYGLGRGTAIAPAWTAVATQGLS